MSANDRQEGGSHYTSRAIQPWDYIVANGLGYLEGNIIKYVTRWKEKGGLEDLRKAQHYLEKLMMPLLEVPRRNCIPLAAPPTHRSAWSQDGDSGSYR